MTLVQETTETTGVSVDGNGSGVPNGQLAKVAGGNKLAAKLAWREVCKRRGRTALVVLLIAAPSLALVVASTAARTNMHYSPLWGQRGSADVVINGSYLPTSVGVDADGSVDEFSNADDTQATAFANLPAGSTVISYLASFVNIEPSQPVNDPSGVLWVQFSNMHFDEPETIGIVDITDGRAPTPGQLMLSLDLADELGVGVGDQLSLHRPSGTWTVSGIGRYSHNFSGHMMVIPGFDATRLTPDADQNETLIFLPPEVGEAERQTIANSVGGYVPGGDAWGMTGDPKSGELALGWLIAAMAFLAFGIVIAAAFATSAHSQLITVGQLSANGASARLIKRVLAWQGMWSGLIGATSGIAVALVCLPFLRGVASEYFFNRSISWVISPIDILAIAITAIVASLVAAAIPSRSLARTSVLSALAGRRPLGIVPPWMAPLGLLLLAGGTGLMVLSLLAARSASGSTVAFTAATLLGGAGLALGTCCLSPVIVSTFAQFATKLPLAGRLSLRSMSRSRGRSAAVISAIAVTVALATAAISGIERDLDANAEPSNVPLNILTLQRADTRLGVFPEDTFYGSDALATIDLPEPQNLAVPTAAIERLEEIFPDAAALPIRMAVHPGGMIDLSSQDPWASAGFSIPIASDGTFAAGQWPEAARDLLATNGFVGISHPETGPNLDYSYRYELSQFGIAGPSTMLTYDTLRYGYWFDVLITEEFALEHGLAVIDAGVIIDNPTAISSAQRVELATVWSALNLGATPPASFIEPGDPLPTTQSALEPSWSITYEYVDDDAMRLLWIARIVALVAALILVGIVVAIGLALAAADNKAERDVLTVVGARPASLRRFAASNAATMTTIGVLMGIPIGFLPTWAIVQSVSHDSRNLPFPWLFVAAITLILPVGMALMAWSSGLIASATTRRSEPSVTQVT